MRSTIALLLFFASLASAQTIEPITLSITPPDIVDGPALARSLQADLETPVTIVDGTDGTAQVVIDGTTMGQLALTVRRAGLPPITRTTEANGDRTEVTIRVALILSNLVRNESRDVVALLVPPLVIYGGQMPQPSPIAPPPLRPPPPELSPMPFAIDFAPGAGFSSGTQGHDMRNFSLGAIGALSGGVSGVSISGVVDLSLHGLTGVQIAGVLGYSSGPLTGVQIAGVVGYSGGPLTGVQIAGVVAFAEGRMEGVQIAGVLAAATGVRGIQISTANLSLGDVEGAQIGVVNVAGESVSGTQIGVVNVGGRVHGLQLGVVNIAEEADASLGLFAIQTRGRTQLRLGGDTTGLFGASVVHGGRYTHSILTAAFDPLGAHAAVAFGVGFGGRIPVMEEVALDIDGMTYVLLDETIRQTSPSFIHEVRLVLNVDIVPNLIGLYFGGGYQFHLSPDATPGVSGPIGVTDFGGNNPHVHGWPTILGGIQLF